MNLIEFCVNNYYTEIIKWLAPTMVLCRKETQNFLSCIASLLFSYISILFRGSNSGSGISKRFISFSLSLFVHLLIYWFYVAMLPRAFLRSAYGFPLILLSFFVHSFFFYFALFMMRLIAKEKRNWMNEWIGWMNSHIFTQSTNEFQINKKSFFSSREWNNVCVVCVLRECEWWMRMKRNSRQQ